MSAVEWNKKEDLLQDQALRHLKKYVALFAAFTKNTRSELALLNRIQEYCYDNMNFLKSFNKIVLLLYKSKFITYFIETNSLVNYPFKGWQLFDVTAMIQRLQTWLAFRRKNKTPSNPKEYK